ncbi:MAG: PspC domain-containing protein [Rhodoglobus sp.]
MTAFAVRPPLQRPRSATLSGVCTALANHLGWRRGRVRLLAIVTSLCGGAGLLLYFWLWALVPLEPTDTESQDEVHRRVPVAMILVIISSISAACVVLVTLGRGPSGSSPFLFAVALTSATAVAWSLGIDRHDASRSERYGVWVRSVAAAIIIACSIAVWALQPGFINSLFATALIIAGVGLLAAPRIVALWSDLITERTARIREEHRAEVAAHLHDSVLQTLALIQNRAGASSEIARIARAQERELREWLFEGDAAASTNCVAEMRAIAATIELDYPVRFDVVTVGEVPGDTPGALVSAAREAMLNAARHAGGDVSIYIESSARGVDVFVRDRGPGVDLNTLPADRLGIRESIIGRMARAGGTASVRQGTGGAGTEVHLWIEEQA